MAKSSGQAIRDFFIQLGFDGKEVTKGFKNIEKEFGKLQKSMSVAAKAQAKSQALVSKQKKDQVKSERELFNIEKERKKLRTKLEKIRSHYKKSGAYAPEVYKDHWNALRSKDKLRIEKASFSLNDEIKQIDERAARHKKHIAALEKENERQQKEIDKAEKVRLKDRKLMEAQIRRDRIAGIREAYAVDRHQMKLMRDYQAASDKRFSANARISRISDRANWMLQRQGGQHPRLSGTSEFSDYNEKLSAVTNQTQTARTASDFRRLNQAISDLNLSYNKLIVKNRQLQKEFKASAFTAKALQDSMRNLARSYVSVFAVVGGAGMAGMVGQELVALRTSLLAASGDATSAAESFEFVKSVALGMGTDLSAATKGFSRISIAAKNAGLSTDEAKNIFLAATEASTTFALSTEDTAGVLRAFDQILSKGKVQAEELRGQLGDRLTGAFYIAAEAMGYTSEELNKMMEMGKLGSKEFMIPFANQLREVVREGGAFEAGLNTSRVAMSRFGTAFKLNVLDSFDAGIESGLAEFFNSLTTVLEEKAPFFRIIGKILGGVLEFLGVTLQMLSQLVRPASIFFDTIMNGGEGSSEVLKGLINILKTIAALIVFPFAVLEKWNNAIETMDGSLKMLAAGGLALVVLQMKRILMLMGAIKSAGAVGVLDKIKDASAAKSWKSTSTVGSRVTAAGTVGKLGGAATVGMLGYNAYDWWQRPLEPLSNDKQFLSSGDIIKNFVKNGWQPYPQDVTFNINGVTDPVAVGEAVDAKMNSLMTSAYKPER